VERTNSRIAHWARLQAATRAGGWAGWCFLKQVAPPRWRPHAGPQPATLQAHRNPAACSGPFDRRRFRASGLALLSDTQTQERLDSRSSRVVAKAPPIKRQWCGGSPVVQLHAGSNAIAELQQRSTQAAPDERAAPPGDRRPAPPEVAREGCLPACRRPMPGSGWPRAVVCPCDHNTRSHGKFPGRSSARRLGRTRHTNPKVARSVEDRASQPLPPQAGAGA